MCVIWCHMYIHVNTYNQYMGLHMCIWISYDMYVYIHMWIWTCTIHICIYICKYEFVHILAYTRRCIYILYILKCTYIYVLSMFKWELSPEFTTQNNFRNDFEFIIFFDQWRGSQNVCHDMYVYVNTWNVHTYREIHDMYVYVSKYIFRSICMHICMYTHYAYIFIYMLYICIQWRRIWIMDSSSAWCREGRGIWDRAVSCSELQQTCVSRL